MAPLLLIELILELVGATFGGMMLACICAIYILCDKLVQGGTQLTVKCKMFEDNSAALTLANAPAMCPRTKHINVKYHFFRRHVYSPSNPSGRIKIMACKSADNIADILTKPVDLVTLLHLRH
jgi:hypothetical protein